VSDHSALVAGDSENLGGISLRGRRATAGFRPDSALGPWSLRWVRSLLPGEEDTGWWAEVTSCLAETPDSGQRGQYERSFAGRCRSWYGPAGRHRFVA